MLKKFVASPFSGYLAIALLLASAGAAYWFWTQAEELGSLEQRAQQQAVQIETQAQQLATLQALSARKDEALRAEAADKEKLLVVAHTMKGMIHDARAKANDALKECMDMHVAGGMQFGPSSADKDSDDKASAVVDG